MTASASSSSSDSEEYDSEEALFGGSSGISSLIGGAFARGESDSGLVGFRAGLDMK
jgi:hypothetical protein